MDVSKIESAKPEAPAEEAADGAAAPAKADAAAKPEEKK
jgi:hypothetical protein